MLLGKNGGKTVRVLKAGVEGQPSTVLIDLELDFDREGYENLSVARDFAFVESNGRTLFIMPSGTSNDVAIVDFTDNFATTYVKFTDKEFINKAPHGRYRSVEWAVGTDYVWTNDSDLDEHYVIDVIQGKVVKTIPNIQRSSMLSVQNYERMRAAEQQATLMQTMQVTQEKVKGPSVVATTVVASLALVVGIVNLGYMYTKNKSNSATSNKEVTGQEFA